MSFLTRPRRALMLFCEQIYCATSIITALGKKPWRSTSLGAATCLLASLGVIFAGGCRGYQYGHLVRNDSADMVGSHAAGSEVYKPLIEESVGKLLGACQVATASASFGPDGMPLPCRVCFVGVENKSSEELGDFKEQIYELIDTEVNRAAQFLSLIHI